MRSILVVAACFLGILLGAAGMATVGGARADNPNRPISIHVLTVNDIERLCNSSSGGIHDPDWTGRCKDSYRVLPGLIQLNDELAKNPNLVELLKAAVNKILIETRQS